jgi:hypothetical protein
LIPFRRSHNLVVVPCLVKMSWFWLSLSPSWFLARVHSGKRSYRSVFHSYPCRLRKFFLRLTKAVLRVHRAVIDKKPLKIGPNYSSHQLRSKNYLYPSDGRNSNLRFSRLIFNNKTRTSRCDPTFNNSKFWESGIGKKASLNPKRRDGTLSDHLVYHQKSL